MISFITFISLSTSDKSQSNGIYTDIGFESLTNEEYETLDIVDLEKGDATIDVIATVNNLNRNENYYIVVRMLYNEQS